MRSYFDLAETKSFAAFLLGILTLATLSQMGVHDWRALGFTLVIVSFYWRAIRVREISAGASVYRYGSRATTPPERPQREPALSGSKARPQLRLLPGGLLVSSLAIMTLWIWPARADDKIDSEHLFGFVEGSDIGSMGEREVKNETTVRTGRATGSFTNVANELEIKYTIANNLRIATGATFSRFDVDGVVGVDQAHRVATQSASFNARVRVLERDSASPGITLSFEPHWGFVDETSGTRIGHFGTQLALLIDREIIPQRLLGAFNLSFENDRVRPVAPSIVQHESILSSGVAVATQASPGIWLGAELRYLRNYDGALLNAFAGQAIYFGPTAFAALPHNFWLSAALNGQLWGRATGVGGSLDLTNFERYQAKVRIGFNF